MLPDIFFRCLHNHFHQLKFSNKTDIFQLEIHPSDALKIIKLVEQQYINNVPIDSRVQNGHFATEIQINDAMFHSVYYLKRRIDPLPNNAFTIEQIGRSHFDVHPS